MSHAHKFDTRLSSFDEGEKHTHLIEIGARSLRSGPPMNQEGGHVHIAVIDGEQVKSGPPVEDKEKLTLAEMIPEKVRAASDKELLSVNRRLHQLYNGNFLGSNAMTAGGINRENLINAAIFIWDEMERRGMVVSDKSPLWRATQSLKKGAEWDGVSEREEVYLFFASNFWEDE